MENNEDYNKLYKFCLKLIDLLEEYKYDLSSCGCCDGVWIDKYNEEDQRYSPYLDNVCLEKLKKIVKDYEKLNLKNE